MLTLPAAVSQVLQMTLGLCRSGRVVAIIGDTVDGRKTDMRAASRVLSAAREAGASQFVLVHTALSLILSAH